MFPDSDIVVTFTCGSEKMARISKFGLVPYIFELLLANADKDAFFFMFDESLNQTTNTKQLDLHVRYWCDDRVHKDTRGHSSWGTEQLRHYKVIGQQTNMEAKQIKT